MAERTEKQLRVKWTEQMLLDAVKCKEEATALTKSNDPPRREHGRKIGYMELMMDKWNALGYGHLNISAQNLRDRVAAREKKSNHLEEENTKPISETILAECHRSPRTESQSEPVENQDTLLDESKAEGWLAPKTIPEDVYNALFGDSDEGDSTFLGFNESDVEPSQDTPTVPNEGKSELEAAEKLLYEINSAMGDMSKRKWKTNIRKAPSQESLNQIDNSCAQLLHKYNVKDIKDPWSLLWMINCTVYATVVSWLLKNDIQCEIKAHNNRPDGNLIPKWLSKIEHEVSETRKFVSQCEAERARLCKNGRLTRKMRKNRTKISSSLKEGETISATSLTVLIEKNKQKLRTLAQSRKRKIKNWKSNKLNQKFENDQKSVYDHLKALIQETPDNPVYREQTESTRRVFDNVEDVESFWAELWEKHDSGDTNAEWLREIEDAFKLIVPTIDMTETTITTTDLVNALKKKKNWSAAGPDKITNFWWKKMTSVHPLVHAAFQTIINSGVQVALWFSMGRVLLFDKGGVWSIPNHRPITCANNLYKWYTALLLQIIKEHLNRYHLMQIDQRGAKSKSSGTTENLLIDDMILKDARTNKKNLSCAWIDVRKAYDSVSHSWLKYILKIHRFPHTILKALNNVIDTWNVVIEVPTSNGIQITRTIRYRNGQLQGDSLGPAFYTLAKNPISWKLRHGCGYVLSAPGKEKITHSLFIDDLKKYDKAKETLRNILGALRGWMRQAGLEWNEPKCAVIHLIHGMFCSDDGDVVLEDGFTLKCLPSESTYKFLGVPEADVHDIPNLTSKLFKAISQRAAVVWSSPLSDNNKVLATNTFVSSLAEYFFWSEKFLIADLKRMDISIRVEMNVNGAKHSQQMNDILYLPKSMGGRGLRSVEDIYKQTRIKSAIKIISNHTDDRMSSVANFHLTLQRKKRGNIFTDAIAYAKELSIDLVIDEFGWVAQHNNGDDTDLIPDLTKLKLVMQKARAEIRRNNLEKSTWQGVNYAARYKDNDLEAGCFRWLTSWNRAPTNIIREIFDLYAQTIKTKCYEIIRSDKPPENTLCRLCYMGEESTKHLLNECKILAKNAYKKRHDQMLKCLIFQFLYGVGMLDRIPPWFTNKTPKPYYENEKAVVWWDIPEFAGSHDKDGEEVYRPDIKVLVKKKYMLYVIEGTVPWITSRAIREQHKEEKYKKVVRNLKLENPELGVKQLTIIIDSLGGYSKSLCENVTELLGSKVNVLPTILQMQKAVIAGSAHIAKRFKLDSQ